MLFIKVKNMHPLDIVPIFFPQEDSLQEKNEPVIKADTAESEGTLLNGEASDCPSETFTVNGHEISFLTRTGKWMVSNLSKSWEDKRYFSDKETAVELAEKGYTAVKEGVKTSARSDELDTFFYDGYKIVHTGFSALMERLEADNRNALWDDERLLYRYMLAQTQQPEGGIISTLDSIAKELIARGLVRPGSKNIGDSIWLFRKSPDLVLTQKETFSINGYQIRWNGYWSEWQVSHPEIGGCESYKDKGEAIEYACKG